jgi:hypothetical protein
MRQVHKVIKLSNKNIFLWVLYCILIFILILMYEMFSRFGSIIPKDLLNANILLYTLFNNIFSFILNNIIFKNIQNTLFSIDYKTKLAGGVEKSLN